MGGQCAIFPQATEFPMGLQWKSGQWIDVVTLHLCVGGWVPTTQHAQINIWTSRYMYAFKSTYFCGYPFEAICFFLPCFYWIGNEEAVWLTQYITDSSL